MLERPLGFWRAVLWSTITLWIFSALFWHWFDISIQAELARRTSASKVLSVTALGFIGSSLR